MAITDGIDDIEVDRASGSVDRGSSDLELTYDGGDQAIALLFRGVQVDHGATILSATIQFHADEAQSEETNLLVQGLACTDASPCMPSLPATSAVRVTASSFGDRPLTRAGVAWNNVPEWTVATHQTSTDASAAQRTPDIKDVVQEIVNSPGW